MSVAVCDAMALEPRIAGGPQRLIVTTPDDASAPVLAEAVGAPVEFLVASRETLEAQHRISPDWATTGVYVLVGGREIQLGPGDPIRQYDELLGRSGSAEPPGEREAQEELGAHAYTDEWRARFYTGMSRDLLRRMGEHLSKPWWTKALLCRQAAPWPYDIGDIGFLEGVLHRVLDGAYWLRREGHATYEHALQPDRETALERGHVPALLASLRLLGVSLETEQDVKRLRGEGRSDA